MDWCASLDHPMHGKKDEAGLGQALLPTERQVKNGLLVSTPVDHVLIWTRREDAQGLS